MGNNFKNDLAEANELENKLAEILRTKYKMENVTTSSSIIDGSFSDYDVKGDQDGVEISFEVKQDKLVSTTGNIAVETHRILADGTKRDTCISVSKADAFVYYFNSTFYAINTAKLKELTENKPVVNGGDGMRSRCALIKKEEFLKHATKI
jgi:hypothetical protein